MVLKNIAQQDAVRGSEYTGVVVLRTCEVCYVYEGYVGSAVVLYI